MIPPAGGECACAVMFVGLIVLIVLVTLCAILGAIYSYIYFTRINPLNSRARKHSESQTYGTEEDPPANQAAGTHIFMFRKS